MLNFVGKSGNHHLIHHITFINNTKIFRMSRLTIFKYPRSCITFFMLLLLMLGPAQSGWCFQNGEVAVVPDTLLKNCHSVPSVCFTSAGMTIEKGNETIPADCDECLDLSSGDLTTTGIQDRNSAFVFNPSIAHHQLPSGELMEFLQSLSFISHAERPLRTRLNLHKSVQSTILII